MRDLRLDNVSVGGATGLLNLEVRNSQIRVVVVRPSQIQEVADVIVGLKPPRSGSVTIGRDQVSGNYRPIRQHEIRLVPSDGGLLPHLTILRNILFTECVVGRRPNKGPEEQVRHGIAATYGLNDVLDRYPYEVTTGHRRMAGLARALWADPSVVVLEDDPGESTWPALLSVSQPARDADTTATTADTTPGLLSGVATVLITSDHSRAHGLEAPPAAFRAAAIASDGGVHD